MTLRSFPSIEGVRAKECRGKESPYNAYRIYQDLSRSFKDLMTVEGYGVDPGAR